MFGIFLFGFSLFILGSVIVVKFQQTSDDSAAFFGIGLAISGILVALVAGLLAILKVS